MHKVITINLNGKAYQLDDVAFDALRAYLDRAETVLKDNPDRAEIIADLEQAIAEKCDRFLGPHKSVVTADEIDQVLKDMGPVESGTGNTDEAHAQRETAAGGNAKRDASAPRRLYQIREGAMISGICNGLAAYFGIDVTIVRIIFVVLAFDQGRVDWSVLSRHVRHPLRAHLRTARRCARAPVQCPGSDRTGSKKPGGLSSSKQRLETPLA